MRCSCGAAADSLLCRTLGGIVKHYEVLGRDTREQTARINKDLGKKIGRAHV